MRTMTVLAALAILSGPLAGQQQRTNVATGTGNPFATGRATGMSLGGDLPTSLNRKPATS
ncbi:MAG: hypothetical protein WD043_08010 [Gemmatimonadales bacterium]